MYNEDLTCCPYCLTPLKGNEHRCPACSANLDKAKKEVAHDYGGSYMPPEINNTQRASDTQKYYKSNGPSSNVNVFNGRNFYKSSYEQSQNTIQTSPLHSNGSGIKDAQGKKKTSLLSKIVIAVVILSFISPLFEVIGDVIFDLRHGFLGDSDILEYTYDYELGELVTGETTSKDIIEHYKNVDITYVDVPSWLDTELAFTKAPDYEGEEQFYKISEDKLAGSSIETGDMILYFDHNASFIFSSYDDYFTAYYEIGDSEIDLTSSIRTLYDGEDFFEYMQNYAQSHIEDGAEYNKISLENIIDMGDGIAGYAFIETSEYGVKYRVFFPSYNRETGQQEILIIEGESPEYLYDEDNNMYTYEDMELVVSEMFERFYLFNTVE